VGNLALIEVKRFQSARQEVGRFRPVARDPAELGARHTDIVRHAFEPFGVAIDERRLPTRQSATPPPNSFIGE
jgi:hypothetical protein